jgi:hypothetical protein
MPAKELYFRNLLHCYGCIPAYSSTKKMLTKKSLIIKQKVFHLFFFFAIFHKRKACKKYGLFDRKIYTIYNGKTLVALS